MIMRLSSLHCCFNINILDEIIIIIVGLISKKPTLRIKRKTEETAEAELFLADEEQ